MKSGERYRKEGWCSIMKGFDGEYYVFNERDIVYFETDEIGAYALELVDGKRGLREIAEAVFEKYMVNNLRYDEIYKKVKETFDLAIRLGVVRKKKLLW